MWPFTGRSPIAGGPIVTARQLRVNCPTQLACQRREAVSTVNRRRPQGGTHVVPDHRNRQISAVADGSSYIRANFSGAGRDHRSAIREGEARKGTRVLYRWRAGG